MPPSLHGPDIPEKLHYRISEVCELTDTQPYVLKFWEQEFPQLAPEKNRIGQRLYGKRDIELVRRIKYLLQEKDYTIAAVRQALERGGAVQAGQGGAAPSDRRGLRAETAEAQGPGATRGDMREDLSGLLFDQSATAGSGSAQGAGRGDGGRAAGAFPAAGTGLADLALVETLREERDRAVAEAERLRDRLARASCRIRELISSLESLPGPADSADS